MSTLKLSDFDTDIGSLKIEPDLETGSKAAKKLMSSFYSRRDEIKEQLKDKILSKDSSQELRLELRMLNNAIKEYENNK
ncbi:MAG: hypothetical protein WC346_06365 [Methanogenium sp.]|jgi:hypothetical protein